MPNEIGIYIRPSRKYKEQRYESRGPYKRTDLARNLEDILTPSQYYSKRSHASVWTRMFDSYHALWTACLFDAYKILKEGTPNERRLETFWFKSKTNHIGSFLWICRQLGLDSTAIREEVLK